MLFSSKAVAAAVAGFMMTTASADKYQPRIRREWRELNADERQRVADAFWVMKTTLHDEGQALYGEHFANYDDLLIRHACAVMDPRCDQGHSSPAILTFHRAIILTFENSLRAVDPTIEGLPYWDPSLDSELGPGKYYGDAEMSIFSENFFGSKDGNPNASSQSSKTLSVGYQA